MHIFFIIIGILCILLGIAGLVLPIIPGVIFIVLGLVILGKKDILNQWLQKLPSPWGKKIKL